MEQTNEKLRQEVAKRDKGIDELKAKMQQMQEQYSKQIRNLQGIHNQELEAKDREISRLNTLLEKVAKTEHSHPLERFNPFTIEP